MIGRMPVQLPEPLRPVWVEAPHPASLDAEAILAQCSMRRGRTSGPGGQHRNKVQTQVEYLHLPTELSASAGESRSPARNAKMAMSRLRLVLATGARVLATPPEPSALWVSRCVKGRVSVNDEHWDFPAMLAEALDQVLECGLDQKSAALRLECSSSQLIKLVAKHAPALRWWNAARSERGMSVLKG